MVGLYLWKHLVVILLVGWVLGGCVVMAARSKHRASKSGSGSSRGSIITQTRQTIASKPPEQRSVGEWCILKREVLVLMCMQLNLPSRGSTRQLASRLVGFYRAGRDGSGSASGSASITPTGIPDSQVGEAATNLSTVSTSFIPAAPTLVETESSVTNPSAMHSPPLGPRVSVATNNVPSQQAGVVFSSTNLPPPPRVSSHVNSSRLPPPQVSSHVSSSRLPPPQSVEEFQQSFSQDPPSNPANFGFQAPNSSAISISDYINQQIHQALGQLTAAPEESHQISENQNVSQSTIPEAARLPPVSTSVLERIRRGEFINFSDLLPPAASVSIGSTSSREFQVQLGRDRFSEPTITLSSAEDQVKPKVFDYCTWVLAWAVFMQAMFTFHNHLIGALLRYQHNIARMASQYSFANVYAYDQAFRHLVANNPLCVSWDKVDDNLFNTYLRGAPARQDLFCFKCRRRGHLAASCFVRGSNSNNFRAFSDDNARFYAGNTSSPRAIAGNNFRASQAQSTSTATAAVGQQTCRDFNATIGCSRIQCKYLHKCSKCGRVSHNALNCAFRSAPGST